MAAKKAELKNYLGLAMSLIAPLYDSGADDDDTRQRALQILSRASFGLDGYFSCIMTASRVSCPKPHPEPLLKVLEHYAIQPSEALFVGDAEVDRRAAAGAGGGDHHQQHVDQGHVRQIDVQAERGHREGAQNGRQRRPEIR